MPLSDLRPLARPARPALIYALGGGMGHLTRAVCLARRLGPAVVLHSAPRPLPSAPPGVVQRHVTAAEARAALATAEADLLVVDTFPAGVDGGLSEPLLRRFPRRALVRRYLRPGSYPGYAARAARFDTHLIPYTAEASEWDEPPPGRHVGLLLRPVSIQGSDASTELVIIGDEQELPVGWRQVLPRDRRCVHGPFEVLPAARRYLALGAGYNLTYELRALKVPMALVPRERRFDDQFARADRLGAGVYSSRQLTGWLRGGCV